MACYGHSRPLSRCCAPWPLAAAHPRSLIVVADNSAIVLRLHLIYIPLFALVGLALMFFANPKPVCTTQADFEKKVKQNKRH